MAEVVCEPDRNCRRAAWQNARDDGSRHPLPVLLKSLGVLLAWLTVTTLSTLIVLSRSGGLGELLERGALGAVTLAFWVLIVPLGSVAAVQLVRLRPSGRRAAQLLLGTALVYYPLGALLGGGFGPGVAIAAGVAALGLALVSSEPAAVAVGAVRPRGADPPAQ